MQLALGAAYATQGMLHHQQTARHHQATLTRLETLQSSNFLGPFLEPFLTHDYATGTLFDARQPGTRTQPLTQLGTWIFSLRNAAYGTRDAADTDARGDTNALERTHLNLRNGDNSTQLKHDVLSEDATNWSQLESQLGLTQTLTQYFETQRGDGTEEGRAAR